MKNLNKYFIFFIIHTFLIIHCKNVFAVDTTTSQTTQTPETKTKRSFHNPNTWAAQTISPRIRSAKQTVYASKGAQNFIDEHTDKDLVILQRSAPKIPTQAKSSLPKLAKFAEPKKPVVSTQQAKVEKPSTVKQPPISPTVIDTTDDIIIPNSQQNTPTTAVIQPTPQISPAAPTVTDTTDDIIIPDDQQDTSTTTDTTIPENQQNESDDVIIETT